MSTDIELTPKQRRQLKEGLRDAFPTVDELDQFVSLYLDVKLGLISQGGSADQYAFQIVNHCTSRKMINQLVSAAREALPHDDLFRRLEKELGINEADIQTENNHVEETNLQIEVQASSEKASLVQNGEVPEIETILAAITSPFIRELERKLRMDRMPWDIPGRKNPELDVNRTQEYFSDKAIKVFELCTAISALRSDLNSTDFSEPVNNQRVINILKAIKEHSAAVMSLFQDTSPYRLKNLIENSLFEINKHMRSVKSNFDAIRFNYSTADSCTNSHLLINLDTSMESLFISLDVLQKHLRDLSIEARNASPYTN